MPASAGGFFGSLPTANSVTPRTSMMRTAWWATIARPDSETRVGCGISSGSHSSIIPKTMSLAYSCMV